MISSGTYRQNVPMTLRPSRFASISILDAQAVGLRDHEVRVVHSLGAVLLGEIHIGIRQADILRVDRPVAVDVTMAQVILRRRLEGSLDNTRVQRVYQPVTIGIVRSTVA